MAIARKVLTLVYYGLRDGEVRCLRAPRRRDARTPDASSANGKVRVARNAPCRATRRRHAWAAEPCPFLHTLVDESPWCDTSGTPRADNDNLIDSAPLDRGVKVVRPRFAAGAPPGPLRSRRRRLAISRRVGSHAYTIEAFAPVPLGTAPLLQTCRSGHSPGVLRQAPMCESTILQ